MTLQTTTLRTMARALAAAAAALALALAAFAAVLAAALAQPAAAQRPVDREALAAARALDRAFYTLRRHIRHEATSATRWDGTTPPAATGWRSEWTERGIRAAYCDSVLVAYYGPPAVKGVGRGLRAVQAAAAGRARPVRWLTTSDRVVKVPPLGAADPYFTWGRVGSVAAGGGEPETRLPRCMSSTRRWRGRSAVDDVGSVGRPAIAARVEDPWRARRTTARWEVTRTMNCPEGQHRPRSVHPGTPAITARVRVTRAVVPGKRGADGAPVVVAGSESSGEPEETSNLCRDDFTETRISTRGCVVRLADGSDLIGVERWSQEWRTTADPEDPARPLSRIATRTVQVPVVETLADGSERPTGATEEAEVDVEPVLLGTTCVDVAGPPWTPGPTPCVGVGCGHVDPDSSPDPDPAQTPHYERAPLGVEFDLVAARCPADSVAGRAAAAAGDQPPSTWTMVRRTKTEIRRYGSSRVASSGRTVPVGPVQRTWEMYGPQVQVPRHVWRHRRFDSAADARPGGYHAARWGGATPPAPATLALVIGDCASAGGGLPPASALAGLRANFPVLVPAARANVRAAVWARVNWSTSDTSWRGRGRHYHHDWVWRAWPLASFGWTRGREDEIITASYCDGWSGTAIPVTTYYISLVFSSPEFPSNWRGRWDRQFWRHKVRGARVPFVEWNDHVCIDE